MSLKSIALSAVIAGTVIATGCGSSTSPTATVSIPTSAQGAAVAAAMEGAMPKSSGGAPSFNLSLQDHQALLQSVLAEKLDHPPVGRSTVSGSFGTAISEKCPVSGTASVTGSYSLTVVAGSPIAITGTMTLTPTFTSCVTKPDASGTSYTINGSASIGTTENQTITVAGSAVTFGGTTTFTDVSTNMSITGGSLVATTCPINTTDTVTWSGTTPTLTLTTDLNGTVCGTTLTNVSTTVTVTD